MKEQVEREISEFWATISEFWVTFSKIMGRTSEVLVIKSEFWVASFVLWVPNEFFVDLERNSPENMFLPLISSLKYAININFMLTLESGAYRGVGMRCS